MGATDTIIVYLYSYFPAIMLALFFWWMDRFERESFFLIVVAFIWGAFGAGLLSYFWNTFFHIALDVYQQGADVANDMMGSVIVAPFVEELTKGFLIVTLLVFNKVDNITDGILLGVVIGLGFAASENVLYAEDIVYPSSGELAMWHNLWFREIHTTLLHASATAVWGAMLGYSRYLRGAPRIFGIVIGFVLAMVTHGFWNFMASYVSYVQSGPNIIGFVMKGALFCTFGLLLTLFLASVKNQSKIIVNELAEEHKKGVIPAAHIGFFASLVRHPKRYALPKTLSPKLYAQLGVRLAFRKYEYKHNPSTKLLLEIENLRERLKKASDYQPDSLTLNYGR